MIRLVWFLYLMTESGEIIAGTAVQHVIRDNAPEPLINKLIKRFNKAMMERINDKKFTISNMGNSTLQDKDKDLPQ